MRTALLLFAGCITFAAPRWANAAPAIAPTSLVDTFVGTSGTPVGGPIDTFPGADVPFGMVQWSPDTPSQNAGGGYEYTDHQITGFSLTHLSGPGCNVFGDFGILPTVGPIPQAGVVMQQPFSHATEESAPGWYAVTIGNPAIRTELSVTQRTGIGRFTFPQTAQANLLFNVASNQAGVTDAAISIDGPAEISGWASSGFFCSMPDRYTVYFVARFDRPFRSYGTWSDAGAVPNSRNARGPTSGGWVTFDTTHGSQVLAKVGLSFVSTAGARANLDAENRGWDLIAVRNSATERWNGFLNRVGIDGGTSLQRRAFYTALYHTLLHPNVISDDNGLYTGFDGRIHRVRSRHQEYANFSDWDIYRTEVPLLALLAPGETSDMMQSLVDAAHEDGWLPRWALVNGPTSVMGGDSVDPVIAGAYAFGARDFDARAALRAMVKGASTTAPPYGQGWYIERWELNDQYLRKGYVVNTHTTSVAPGPNGASETLEYALDDFSIARVALALHDAPIYSLFLRRSQNWATLFDAATATIAPRDSEGAFMQTATTENGQSGFQEGNAAQYTWMVPHDLYDLIAAMGGSSGAAAKLDRFFSQLNAGQDKPYAWLGNEPSLGTPWVYLSAQEPWRAQEIVRRALTTLYADTPDGLPGNDDLGTMSAWYVWCAIGLYPQNPAVRYLDIGTPLFGSVTIRAPDGPTLQISSSPNDEQDSYIQSLRVNGRPSNRSWIALPLRGNVRLDVTTGTQPNTRWASALDSVPPSFAASSPSLLPGTGACFVTPSNGVRVAAGDSTPVRFSIGAQGETNDESVSWRLNAPAGLHLDPNAGQATIAKTAATVQVQLSVDSSLRAGYYDLRISGTAANGALLASVALPVLVENAAQRPALAYAENLFGNSVTPIDLATLATGPEIAVGEEPRDAALSPDGRRLYVANLGDNTVSVVDTLARRSIATVKTGSSPSGLAMTPDGTTLWLANIDDGTIEPIDTRTLRAGKTIRVGVRPRAIAIAPNGATLYVVNSGSNSVLPVDVQSLTTGKPIAVGERPWAIAITPDGTRLYVVNSASNSVTPIDLIANRALAPISVGIDPVAVAIAPDGHTAYISNHANSTITPIDLRSAVSWAPIEVGGAPYGLAFASEGKTLIVVVGRDNACVFVDRATGRVSRPLPLGSGPSTVAAP